MNENPFSIWVEKPGLSEVEALVAQALPVAVELASGLCEPHAGFFEVALPTDVSSRYGLSRVDHVTPFAENSAADCLHLSVAHPLLVEFSEKVLDSPPVDIVEMKPRGEIILQRVLEKASTVLTFRPSKVAVEKQTAERRVWVHSVYFLEMEATDLGKKVVHLLQDERGCFVEKPEVTLRKFQSRANDFNLVHHECLPQELKKVALPGLSEEIFGAEFKETIERFQKEEIDKAMRYYERLEADINRRLAVAREKKESHQVATQKLEATLERKLERLKQEKQIRLKNIRERYEAQFRVRPVGARALVLPVCRILLKPHEGAQASLVVSYCPVLREFLRTDCPKCGLPCRDFTLGQDIYLCRKCC